MPYEITLAIRNRHGQEDRLVAACFGESGNGDMDAECCAEDGEHFLITGNWLMLTPDGIPTTPPDKDCELFKFVRRVAMVGNVHWDQFFFPPVYACMLATYLSKLPHWTITNYRKHFGEAWERKEFDGTLFLAPGTFEAANPSAAYLAAYRIKTLITSLETLVTHLHNQGRNDLAAGARLALDEARVHLEAARQEAQ